MNTSYLKEYKDKEMKQFVLAYLLVSISSIGFQTQLSSNGTNLSTALFQMLVTDIFVGAICVLVFIFNELWSDNAKTRIIYKELPSNTIFSDIANGKIDATGFDLESARKFYSDLFTASPAKQTAEWNILLRNSKEAEQDNVIEAERLQLMTRDICMSTVSLLIMNIIAIGTLSITSNDFGLTIKTFGIPIIYLVAMFFITRTAARNRANRLVVLVIKNNVQDKLHNDVQISV